MEYGTRPRVTFLFLSRTLPAKMTATGGLLELKKVFSIREIKNTYKL